MTTPRSYVSLPTADRVRAHAFYREALGLEAVGELADDGVPKLLVFVVNEAACLMLIPTGGFGWVAGDNAVAEPGTSECLLGITADRDAEVDAVVEREKTAGAVVTAEPATQPWGYAATFADPDGHLWTVTAATLAGSTAGRIVSPVVPERTGDGCQADDLVVSRDHRKCPRRVGHGAGLTRRSSMGKRERKWKRLPSDLRHAIIRQAAAGRTYEEIVEDLDVGRGTVWRVVRSCGGVFRREQWTCSALRLSLDERVEIALGIEWV